MARGVPADDSAAAFSDFYDHLQQRPASNQRFNTSERLRIMEYRRSLSKLSRLRAQEKKEAMQGQLAGGKQPLGKGGPVTVKGYTRSDGTKVKPFSRSK